LGYSNIGIGLINVAKKRKNLKVQLIAIGCVVSIVILGVIAESTILWVTENYKLAISISVVAVVVGISLFVWWWTDNRKRKKDFFWQVVDAIKKFKYCTRFNEEEPYHAMLYGYLVGIGFKDIKYIPITGWARPDMAIRDIVIEVKGPVVPNSLQTLADKVMRYSDHYSYFIVVLFEPRYGDDTLNRTMNGLDRMADKFGVTFEHITKHSDK
jgi:NADH:ubiquinone oxidoreductase subunit K